MNDFTKEELIDIRNNLSVEHDKDLNERLKDLYWKIKSMIDNYKEYETVSVRGEPRLVSEFIEK